MARPKNSEKHIIEIRNRLIRALLIKKITQADIARVFRIPRNTVYLINNK